MYKVISEAENTAATWCQLSLEIGRGDSQLAKLTETRRVACRHPQGSTAKLRLASGCPRRLIKAALLTGYDSSAIHADNVIPCPVIGRRTFC
jgi:hypothetical protein